MRIANIVKVGLQAIARNKMRSALDHARHHHRRRLRDRDGRRRLGRVALDPGADRLARHELPDDLPRHDDAARGRGCSPARRSSPSRTSTAIRAECPSVAYVSAASRTSAQVVGGRAQLGDADPGRRRRLALHPLLERRRGRFLHRRRRPRGDQGLRPRADRGRRALPRRATRSGRRSAIKNVPFRVVGVLETKGGSTMGQDQDDRSSPPTRRS